MKRQDLLFAKAVNWADRRAPANNNQAQVHALRVDTLQSITEALDKKAPTGLDREDESYDEPSASGNE